MRICVMSDLHGYLPKPSEETELTLICGDILPLDIQRRIKESKYWLNNEFAYWVNNWPSNEIFYVAGNHDFVFEANWTEDEEREYNNVVNGKLKYLTGDITKIYIDSNGKEWSIFGTPYCHQFGRWAFMYSDDKLKELYEPMPENCDIVISHDAADINDLGMIPSNAWHSTPENAGNKVLAEFIKSRKPKYYFCGHIHEGNHRVTEVDGTTMANVSILNDRYQFYYEPLYLDI